MAGYVAQCGDARLSRVHSVFVSAYERTGPGARSRRAATLWAGGVAAAVVMFVSSPASAQTVFGGGIGTRHAPFGLRLQAAPGQADMPPLVGHVGFDVYLRCPGPRPDVSFAAVQRIVGGAGHRGPRDLRVR